MRSALIAGALLGLLLAACGGVPRGDVEVTLTDYAIAVPDSVTVDEQDRLRMEVRVDGRAHHNLTICPATVVDTCAGDPVVQRIERTPPQARDPSAVPEATTALVLGNGWDATVAATLPPGTYRFYCGIIGHAERGMQALVEVHPTT